MEYLILFTIWEIAMLGAGLVGFLIGRKHKSSPKPQKPTEEDIKAMKRSQKEYENFMSYSGVAQDVISD